MTDKHRLITAQELAEALGVSVETVWRYTREGRIPHVELGNRQYRYRLEQVMSALDSTAAPEEAADYGQADGTNLTYEDYLQLPEEPGYTYEVLEGTLVKEPAPSVSHQRASRRLQRLLEDYFWQEDPASEVFNAPLDVTLEAVTVVQPDLVYITGDQGELIKKKRIDGVPPLLVEVVSPGSFRRDRLQKLSIYQKAGVQHYWLVDPEERTLECFELRDGVYSLVAAGMDGDTVKPPAFPGLAIKLEQLWSKPGA
jgi:excisionase family DNA binding protein